MAGESAAIVLPEPDVVVSTGIHIHCELRKRAPSAGATHPSCRYRCTPAQARRALARFAIRARHRLVGVGHRGHRVAPRDGDLPRVGRHVARVAHLRVRRRRGRIVAVGRARHAGAEDCALAGVGGVRATVSCTGHLFEPATRLLSAGAVKIRLARRAPPVSPHRHSSASSPDVVCGASSCSLEAKARDAFAALCSTSSSRASSSPSAVSEPASRRSIAPPSASGRRVARGARSLESAASSTGAELASGASAAGWLAMGAAAAALRAARRRNSPRIFCRSATRVLVSYLCRHCVSLPDRLTPQQNAQEALPRPLRRQLVHFRPRPARPPRPRLEIARPRRPSRQQHDRRLPYAPRRQPLPRGRRRCSMSAGTP